MEESAILLTLTQVTVAFVGFASIVATFRFKDEFTIKKNDAINLELIVNTGLVGSFFSVLPLALSSFGFQDVTVWTLCSAIMSVNYLGFMYYLSKKVSISKFRKKKSKMIVILYFAIGIMVFVLNVLNAFDVLFHRKFGPFLVSLLYPLCMVGYMFSRLLFFANLENYKRSTIR